MIECPTCRRYVDTRFKGNSLVCLECGEIIYKYCKDCGDVMRPPEVDVCGMCQSALEHAGEVRH